MSQVLQCTQFAALIFSFRPVALFRHFIDCGRAKILAGVSVLFHASRRTNVEIQNLQMARLIFFMPRAGVIDIRETVERQLAIALKPLRRRPSMNLADTP